MLLFRSNNFKSLIKKQYLSGFRANNLEIKTTLSQLPLRKCQPSQLSPIKRPINHCRATRFHFSKHHSCTGSKRVDDKIGSISARKYENAPEIASPVNFSSGCEWNEQSEERNLLSYC